MLINKRPRLQRGKVIRWQLLLLVCTIIASQEPVLAATTSQPDYCSNPPAAAKANPYRTEAWDGKFLYGGYSTLISSHIMGTRHRILINLLNRSDARENEITRRLRDFQNDFCSLTENQTKAILAFARDNRSNSIYQEERSAIFTEEQNRAFIAAMSVYPKLKPVDSLIQNGEFTQDNFQFNTHRALYNNAYGIAQNSLAAIVNAYVVGIRSVEFDVLESKDDNNVVIHDLTTNRLTGSFNDPPVYVGTHSYPELKQTNIDILDPLKNVPSVQSTGIKELMTTEHVLSFMYKYLPEMTAYVDARNDAPVSFIEILSRHPEYKDKFVLKIYPFTLRGGLNSLIEEYAFRKGMRFFDAAAEIAKIRPNVLLAMGSTAKQADEQISLVNFSDFTWDEFNRQRKNLPFTRAASNDYKTFNGQPIFDEATLIRIEAMSYNLGKWALDFFAATNVMVFQVNINPSLQDIVKQKNTAEFNAMPPQERELAAVIDNFIALYHLVEVGDFNVNIYDQDLLSVSKLSNKMENTVWGFSDRYPDYTFANELTSGAINQSTIRDFLYSMEGVVYEKNDYSALKMRSTQAVADKLQEMGRMSLTPGYATTDLPTDLRLDVMGILGTLGLPKDLRYRASALIKPRFLPENTVNYQRPLWTERLYGTAAKGREKEFDVAVANIVAKNSEVSQIQSAINAIRLSLMRSVIITNTISMSEMKKNEPFFARDADIGDVNTAIKKLTDRLSQAQLKKTELLDNFKRDFGVPFASVDAQILNLDYEYPTLP